MIAVYGANGFVGSAIVRALERANLVYVPVVRGDPDPVSDILINAACPSQRLRAERDPEWDFEETVAKSARLYYRHKGRFVQISSVSAFYPQNSVYGAHRAMAETMIRKGLVIRLGPMYGIGLTKGVLRDIIDDRVVYADPEAKHAYADVDWCADRIVKLATGRKLNRIIEVGGADSITLRELRDRIGSESDFTPSEFLPREDQDFISPDGPKPSEAIRWAIEQRSAPRLDTHG